MHCLQIHDEEHAFGEWQFFYSDIAGFDFQPGKLYRISVRITERSEDPLPADISSLRYELIEVIEERPDPRAALHDIYVLEATADEKIRHDRAGSSEARIEFNIVQARYAGNDGCRDFDGAIEDLDGRSLRLAPATVGDSKCAGDTQPTDLLLHLANVAAWRRNGLLLELLNANGERQLLFRKVD